MIKEKPNKNYDDIVKELDNKFLNLNMNTKLLIRQLITENRNEIN